MPQRFPYFLMALSVLVLASYNLSAQSAVSVWARPQSELIGDPRIYHSPKKDENFAFLEIENAATGWGSVSGFSLVQLKVAPLPGTAANDEVLDAQRRNLLRVNRLTVTYLTRSNYRLDTYNMVGFKFEGQSLYATLPDVDTYTDGFIEVHAYEEKDGQWTWLAQGRTALDSASPGLFRVRAFPYQIPVGSVVFEDGSTATLEKPLPRKSISQLVIYGTGVLGTRCDQRATARLVVNSGSGPNVLPAEVQDTEASGWLPGLQYIKVLNAAGALNVPSEGFLRAHLEIRGCAELMPGAEPSVQYSNQVDIVFEGAEAPRPDNPKPEAHMSGWSTEGVIPRSPSENLTSVAPYARTRESWELRKAAIRKQFLQATRLEPRPEKTELFPLVHTIRQREGYVLQNVSFEATPGFVVTGNLYLPMNRFGKRPGILLSHGHFEKEAMNQGGYSPRTMHETQILAAQLARAGAVVFAYDMVGYGESMQAKHSVKNVMQLQTWNSMRAIDFLATLQDDFGAPLVDMERIGATGASGGATQGLYAQIADERISAFAPVVMIAAGHRGAGEVCEEGMPVHNVPGEARTNNTEMSAMMAPKPTMFVSVGADWTRWFHNEEFGYVQHIYGLYRGQNQTRSENFPGEGHDYGPSKRRVVYDFFEKHFGLDSDKPASGRLSVQNPEGIELQRNQALRAISGAKRRIAKPVEMLR